MTRMFDVHYKKSALLKPALIKYLLSYWNNNILHSIERNSYKAQNHKNALFIDFNRVKRFTSSSRHFPFAKGFIQIEK